jgi:hypothetical protein
MAIPFSSASSFYLSTLFQLCPDMSSSRMPIEDLLLQEPGERRNQIIIGIEEEEAAATLADGAMLLAEKLEQTRIQEQSLI